MKINQLFDLSKNYFYIVDTSYIVFCAASAAFKDYVYQNDVPKSSLSPDFDPTLDQEFNVILRDKFIARIENAIRSYSPFTFNKSNFIFTVDCPRKEIWRREIFPEYKLTRDTADHSKDEFNIGKVFKYVYDFIIPNYCEETGSIVVQSSYAESDDIIFVLTKKLLNDSKDNLIVILSSDRDMVQLYDERVSILTIQNEVREPKKELEALTKTEIKEDVDVNDFLLFKILIGDGSDNIPSVKHRLGPKGALKYVLDKSRSNLKELLKEDVNILNGFKRNKKLISMNKIPSYMVESITESIDEAFANRKKVEKVDPIEKVDEVDDILKDIL